MSRKNASTQGPNSKTGSKSEAEQRAERLKAALKSNMGRRKAQARARTVSENDTGNNKKSEQGQ